MSVVGSVESFLAGLGGQVEDDPLAASALALAAELDDVDTDRECEQCGHQQSWIRAHNSATSKSMIAKEMRETLACLRELAPPKEQEDEIERARRRRNERLSGQSASGASSPS